jgi:DNA repair photolyase/predicted NAD-dependent protein-ADP-ribosyltransferase YbiA (DUF1768 family)
MIGTTDDLAPGTATTALQTTGPSNGHSESKIWPAGKIGRKPRYLIDSKSVISLESDFGHKLLCDGPTFTAGHACVFSCAFCYVEAIMRKNARLNALVENEGLKHEQVVVEINDPVTAARAQLLFADGKPRFKDPDDTRVIYASPLVDVAGTPKQVDDTIAICREILQHTHWQIRLLSKSRLLVKVAEALSEYKKRMIYGFSTGTLEDDLTRSFEIGTSSVSERLKALKKLQRAGFRTFGMLCPILPQSDYTAYAKKVAKEIDIDKCEDVWAEALNSRGSAMRDTSAALRRRGFILQADLMDKVATDGVAWEEYAEQTFLALTKVIPAKKLHYLQYVDPKNYNVWEKHQSKGAVLLGVHAKLMEDVLGESIDPEAQPLSKAEKQQLIECEAVIRENATQFVQVGLALKKIKDGKLYRATHSSFEGYCLANFDFGRIYGYRLIKSAEVVEELKKVLPAGNTSMLTSETHVRELAKVTPTDRPKVLKLAVAKAKDAGDKPLNSIFIQQAAMEIAPAAPKAKSEARYTPASYTTDLKVFLYWVAKLKELAKNDDKKPLLQLLDKAEKDKAIVPEMPDMVAFTNADEINGWLNPMSDHPVKYEKQTFRTADALFQWRRFEGHKDVQAEILADPSPISVRVTVKKNQKLLKPVGEADLDLMRLCLKLKVDQHAGLKANLKATGDKLIVQDCTSHPRGEVLYWGMALINGQWVGENWLGRLWMELRGKSERGK